MTGLPRVLLAMGLFVICVAGLVGPRSIYWRVDAPAWVAWLLGGVGVAAGVAMLLLVWTAEEEVSRTGSPLEVEVRLRTVGDHARYLLRYAVVYGLLTAGAGLFFTGSRWAGGALYVVAVALIAVWRRQASEQSKAKPRGDVHGA